MPCFHILPSFRSGRYQYYPPLPVCLFPVNSAAVPDHSWSFCFNSMTSALSLHLFSGKHRFEHLCRPQIRISLKSLRERCNRLPERLLRTPFSPSPPNHSSGLFYDPFFFVFSFCFVISHGPPPPFFLPTIDSPRFPLPVRLSQGKLKIKATSFLLSGMSYLQNLSLPFPARREVSSYPDPPSDKGGATLFILKGHQSLISLLSLLIPT